MNFRESQMATNIGVVKPHACGWYYVVSSYNGSVLLDVGQTNNEYILIVQEGRDDHGGSKWLLTY